MALHSASGAGRLAARVNAENEESHLVRLGTLGMRVEHPKIGDVVSMVVVGQPVGPRNFRRNLVAHAHLPSALMRAFAALLGHERGKSSESLRLMPLSAWRGALNNIARNAVVKFCEDTTSAKARARE
jgi:hypothetical protein